jgi:hypothetical protein
MLKSSAIVCERVPVNRVPITRAIRSQPVAPEDTGWQFFCGKAEEHAARAQIWLITTGSTV